MQMSELGAANYAKKIAPAKDSLSQREAYEAFGEARVKRWVSMNLVNTIRSGNTSRSKLIYSMAELLAVDASERLNQIIIKNHVISTTTESG